MRVGIIGAGFTGLAASYRLVKSGHEVVVFEKDGHPGGLAIGFQKKDWDWSLEKHYHHWFTNDDSVLGLAKEIGHAVVTKRPKTSVYVNDAIYQLDSPAHVLSFPLLTPLEKMRMAGVLGALRYNPFWKPLEKVVATDFLSAFMGKRAYEMLWKPQLQSKFGKHADEISLAWFWARIKKRTSSLAYPEGGFLRFAQHLNDEIVGMGTKIHYETEVVGLDSFAKHRLITYRKGKEKKKKEHFDAVIVTTPSFLFLKISSGLPAQYKKQLMNLKGLGAINVVLRMKKPFLKDETYWLSVCEEDSPVMAIVEHTNFMNKKHYSNERLVYLGNYLPHDHAYFSLSGKQLLGKYDSFLKTINKDYGKYVLGVEKFDAPFAQPIIPLNYSKMIPSFETPLKNVYLANMQQVYPWDRGTNYAVELGEGVVEKYFSTE